MEVQFTYESYGDLLDALRKNEYTICDYYFKSNDDKQCILRHDVDYSLDKAVELANFEKTKNVSSTYFISLTGDFYNIASKHSFEKIEQIIHCGHDIGLHFDELKYAENIDLIPKIKQECDFFSKMIGYEVKSVSMHRPSTKTLEADYKIEGIQNSYAKKFFKDYKYISDSRRNWRENPYEFIGSVTKLHILTHPFWYNEVEETIYETVNKFLDNAKIERHNALQENIRDLSLILDQKD